jgi:hypothetical protein
MVRRKMCHNASAFCSRKPQVKIEKAQKRFITYVVANSTFALYIKHGSVTYVIALTREIDLEKILGG